MNYVKLVNNVVRLLEDSFRMRAENPRTFRENPEYERSRKKLSATLSIIPECALIMAIGSSKEHCRERENLSDISRKTLRFLKLYRAHAGSEKKDLHASLALLTATLLFVYRSCFLSDDTTESMGLKDIWDYQQKKSHLQVLLHGLAPTDMDRIMAISKRIHQENGGKPSMSEKQALRFFRLHRAYLAAQGRNY